MQQDNNIDISTPLKWKDIANEFYTLLERKLESAEKRLARLKAIKLEEEEIALKNRKKFFQFL